MQAQFFKSANPNDLNEQVRKFIAENGRELRDVRIAFGIASDGGMLDYAIAACVLYDEPAIVPFPCERERVDGDESGEKLRGIDERALVARR